MRLCTYRMRFMIEMLPCKMIQNVYQQTKIKPAQAFPSQPWTTSSASSQIHIPSIYANRIPLENRISDTSMHQTPQPLAARSLPRHQLNWSDVYDVRSEGSNRNERLPSSSGTPSSDVFVDDRYFAVNTGEITVGYSARDAGWTAAGIDGAISWLCDVGKNVYRRCFFIRSHRLCRLLCESRMLTES